MAILDASHFRRVVKTVYSETNCRIVTVMPEIMVLHVDPTMGTDWYNLVGSDSV